MILSLFSGVGGLDRAIPGPRVAHVERDPFAASVLRRHWPGVDVIPDVRDVRNVRATGVIGGPPCQAASQAGARQGEADDRWMWPETIRVLRESGASWAFFENVTGLLTLNKGRAFAGILHALNALGLTVRWDCCTAAEVGRPHLRDRVWIACSRGGALPWMSVPIDQVRAWPRAGIAIGGRTSEEVARWPKRRTWPLVSPGVCPPAGMWPTPGAALVNDAEDLDSWAARRDELKAKHGNWNGTGTPLGVAARLWPTPAAADAADAANVTARRDGSKGGDGRGHMGVTLVDAIRLWPTPNASDAEMVKHHAGKGPSLAMAAGQWKADRLTGGRLSPAWVETLLMGWPPGWTEPEGEALAEAPGAPHDAEMFARLTGERTRERRERLRCIGNGVVSAVARLTFAALLPDVLTLRGAA